ncbi:MAG: AAA family ATPase [Solirubrobacteraceae bacterium]
MPAAACTLNAPFSIGLAGRISSGKSTLAGLLAERLNLPRIAFGDYIRAQAQTRGLDTERPTLQAIGAEQLESLGPGGLCRAAAHWARVNLDSTAAVWDGVRHVAVADVLRQLQAPRACYLIGLRASEPDRQRRVEAEAGSMEEREAWERDSTEHELDAVFARSDLVIESHSAEDALAQTLVWLAEHANMHSGE